VQTWERSDSDTFRLTQEFLGEMLGVQRTSVSDIASKLQAADIIRYRRGQIEVLNRLEWRNVPAIAFARFVMPRKPSWAFS
jgi:hypothetical protein